MFATTPTTYTVKAGDTLSQIAANQGVSIKDITGYKSGDINKIGVGEVLNIGGTPITTPPASTINVGPNGSNLNSTPYVAPPVATPTASTGLVGAAKSYQDTITKYTSEVDKEKNDITSTYDAISGQATKKADAYAAPGGVNEAKTALDSINAEMTSADKSYNDQVNQIQENNPTGQLSSGQQIQINKLTKDHAYTMSNLAIVANVKLNNYNNVKSLIDQQISAETEDLQTKLDGQKYFYQQNFATLTEAQKGLLNEQIKATETEKADKTKLLSDLGSVKMEAAKNGAPASVLAKIGKATSLDEGITAAGSYLGLYDRKNTQSLIDSRKNTNNPNSYNYTFSNVDKGRLIGVGLTNAQIAHIEQGAASVGLPAVIAAEGAGLSDVQKAALQSIYDNTASATNALTF